LFGRPRPFGPMAGKQDFRKSHSPRP
jgi:hypothetical protein